MVFASFDPATNFDPDKLTILIAWQPTCVGCEPVKRLVKRYMEAHLESNMDVFTINIDEQNSNWIANVRTLPAVIFIKHSEVIDTLTGTTSYENLSFLIRRYLKKSSGHTD
jgi:thiol-disulfide isomerase/thioredoxin